MILSFRRYIPLLMLGGGVLALVLVVSTLPTGELPIVQFTPHTEPYTDLQRPLQALYQLEVDAASSGWTPENAERAGHIWRELGVLANAVAYWELADDGASPVVRRALAEAYIEMGQWALASDKLSLLVTDSNASARAWASLQLGLLHISSDPALAQSYFEAALADDPGYAASLSSILETLAVTSNPTRLGMSLARLGMWSHAERVFADAPADPVALAFVALSRDMQGKDGSLYLNAALRLGSADAQVRFIEGLYYRLQGDYEASLNAFIQAVAIHPDDPALYAELGTAYQLMGDLVTAERWLQFAVDLSGGDPRYAQRVEALYSEEQQLHDAVAAMLEQSAAIPPTTVPN